LINLISKSKLKINVH